MPAEPKAKAAAKGAAMPKSKSKAPPWQKGKAPPDKGEHPAVKMRREAAAGLPRRLPPKARAKAEEDAVKEQNKVEPEPQDESPPSSGGGASGSSPPGHFVSTSRGMPDTPKPILIQRSGTTGESASKRQKIEEDTPEILRLER